MVLTGTYSFEYNIPTALYWRHLQFSHGVFWRQGVVRKEAAHTHTRWSEMFFYIIDIQECHENQETVWHFRVPVDEAVSYTSQQAQRQNLVRCHEVLDQLPVTLKRVRGTRWVGHIVPAIETYFKGIKAIKQHLEDCVEQRCEHWTQKEGSALPVNNETCGCGDIHAPILEPLRPIQETSQIAKFLVPTWGQSGSCRPVMCPMMAPWTLLSGVFGIAIQRPHWQMCTETLTWPGTS